VNLNSVNNPLLEKNVLKLPDIVNIIIVIIIIIIMHSEGLGIVPVT